MNLDYLCIDIKMRLLVGRQATKALLHEAPISDTADIFVAPFKCFSENFQGKCKAMYLPAAYGKDSTSLSGFPSDCVCVV